MFKSVNNVFEKENIGYRFVTGKILPITDDQEISWDTPYYNDFKNGKIEDPKLEEKIEKIPERTKSQREVKKNKKLVILFAKKWNNLLFNFFDSKVWENIPITIQEAFEFFKAQKEEQANDVSEKFYEMYYM